MKIPISTTVEESVYKEIKAASYHFSELIVLGLQAKKNFPLLLNRLKETEDNNTNLVAKLNKMASRVYFLEENISKKGEEDK